MDVTRLTASMTNLKKIKEMLSKLSDDELRMYDMDNKYDKEDFEDDYNDEVLDGGWWMWILP